MSRPPILLQPAPLLWTPTLARLARANPQITPAQLDNWLRPARLILVTTDDNEPPAAVLLAGSSFGAHMLRLRYADAIHRALAETLRRPVALIIQQRPIPPEA
jgi:chromosomal replication initiation ATPase DnaA